MVQDGVIGDPLSRAVCFIFLGQPAKGATILPRIPGGMRDVTVVLLQKFLHILPLECRDGV